MEQIIKVILAIIFGMAAFAKLSGKTKDVFESSGYGLPFMYATAFAEVLFTIGLFTQYDLWAAIGLVAIILGAIVTLIRQRVTPEKYAMGVLSLVLLSALLLIK
ncbi:MAG: DoxX family protein [Cyclobacteriaceae bacterium]